MDGELSMTRNQTQYNKFSVRNRRKLCYHSTENRLHHHKAHKGTQRLLFFMLKNLESCKIMVVFSQKSSENLSFGAKTRIFHTHSKCFLRELCALCGKVVFALDTCYACYH